MWALRRASLPLRRPGFCVGISHARRSSSEIPITNILEKLCFLASPLSGSDGYLPSKRFYNTTQLLPKFSTVDRRGLSSQAGTESIGDDSELEMASTAEAIPASNTQEDNEDEFITGLQVSDDEQLIEPSQEGMKLSETQTAPNEKTLSRKEYPALFKAIADSPKFSVHKTLDKWVKDGNDLSRDEISTAMLVLRRLQMFWKALEFSEWLEAYKQIEFIERDYVCRLDLIAKLRGFIKAEKYVEMIPQSFRSEVVYRTLLANFVAANNLKKAEDIFNKMKDLKFPVTPFTCNQMLLLYTKLDKTKIADVLLLMEKENVKPTIFTYKMLIDSKGRSNDIAGMEHIYETMNAEGFEPDIGVQASMAKYYVYGGHKEKTEVLLKEMEGGNLTENFMACRYLLFLYAELGKVDEVRRVWKACTKPRIQECLAAIEAFGKLKKIDEAEAVFENMVKMRNKLEPRQCAALLKVYTHHRMLDKGKDLVQRMADSECVIGPSVWDALVKLYVAAGQLEKADSILRKAAEKNSKKPLLSSFMAIMDQYSKRGDIHNTEKIYYRMKQFGYTVQLGQFQCLVHAYINAKAPFYGISERMKADNISPSNALLGKLTLVHPLMKNAVSDLLE